MPYPFPFRPATTCTAIDTSGGTQNGCEIQIFKPLLGCAFNATAALPEFLLPSGGIILRGLLRWDFDQINLFNVGPAMWPGAVQPRIRLDEDDNAYDWRVVDGLNWSLSGTEFLLSFYASKKSEVPNPGGNAFRFEENLFNVWDSPHTPSGGAADHTDVFAMLDFPNNGMLDITPGTPQNWQPPVWLYVKFDDVNSFQPLFGSIWGFQDNTGTDRYYKVRFWEWFDGSRTQLYARCSMDQVTSAGAAGYSAR